MRAAAVTPVSQSGQTSIRSKPIIRSRATAGGDLYQLIPCYSIELGIGNTRGKCRVQHVRLDGEEYVAEFPCKLHHSFVSPLKLSIIEVWKVRFSNQYDSGGELVRFYGRSLAVIGPPEFAVARD